MTGWTEEGLTSTWRALAKPDGSAWRLMALARIGKVGIDAGRRFPGAHEALLVSFPANSGMTGQGLPEGRGYDVAFLPSYPLASDHRAIAITRSDEGSEEIFAIVCLDLLRCMSAEGGSPAEVIDVLIERLADWQAFLARKRRLSTDAQVGLMGELLTLELLLARGLVPPAALKAWVGPMRGAQDFHLGSGSMEAKSTVAKGAFIAKINSIEQLDGERDPQFLRALRFEVEEGGDTLVSAVARLRQDFEAAGVLRQFNALLICAGYLDEHESHYLRGLRLTEARSLRITEDFPRLRRANLPRVLRNAFYTLDITGLSAEPDPDAVFTELGC